jgi:RsiW-degrading membrane proteinase PrsW (M82 family)
VLVIYIYAVDVYEDQPLLVVVLTLAWGAAAGLVVGLVARFLAPAGGEPATFADELIVRGVVLPLVGGIVAALGPVALLVYPKFNDVLDGVTFGAAAGATFGAGQAIGNGIDLLSGGLRPTGETGAWIERLLALGILAPVLWSAVVGAVMAAFWLRYRAPIRDQASLGVLGRPLIAAIAGGLVLVLASSGQVVLGRFAALGWLALLAALAILWLRVTIHLGLLQEAAEIEIGDPVTCANCARTTPHHTFCGRCGIALRALPKGRTSRRDARGADPGDAR